MLLAQAWLHGDDRQHTPHDWELEQHLALPTEHNPHTSVVTLNNYAERIVFTDDVPSLLYQLDENKQLTVEGILQTVKMPYDCFWLEYSSSLGMNLTTAKDKMHFGALVRRVAGGKVCMHIVAGAWYGNRMTSTVLYVIEFKHWPPAYHVKKPVQTQFGMRDGVLFGFDLIHSFLPIAKQVRLRQREQLVNVAAVVTEVIFGIFLITQPRVYEDIHVVPSDKLQRRRTKSGKTPLMDYRKIKLHVLTPPRRYVPTDEARNRPRNEDDPESERAIQHRRYHKVMGHFRHYLRGDSPHTVWIEPHYRGDPKLGVTFTERDVTR